MTRRPGNQLPARGPPPYGPAPVTSADASPDAGRHPLDDPVWHALSGPQRHQAEGDGAARRYQPEIAAFAALAPPEDGWPPGPEAWAALGAVVGPGGAALLAGVDLPEPPEGWKVVLALQGYQMVAAEPLGGPPAAAGGAMPPAPGGDGPPPIRRLTAEDVPAMVELVRLTEPGPFLPRTVEMGAYHGVIEGGRLVAMAGERVRLDGYTEISAVCTHPDARRRGLAAALTRHVARGIAARGDTPFLHVAVGNDGARRVYEALGFRVRRVVDFQMVEAVSRSVEPAS